MYFYNKICATIMIIMLACSCKKITDVQPDSNLIVPSTLADCVALLDDTRVMNGFLNSGYPGLPETISDDYYVTTDLYSTYSLTDQQAAIWARDLPTNGSLADWDLPYRTIFCANSVIELLGKISPGNQQSTWNCTKGRALFYRAFSFYQLAQIFSPAYDSSTASSDWGIPLRLTSDINEKIIRATVQKTYDQILDDLKGARALIPKDSSWLPTRPTLAAVFALLSRVFLSARNYPFALKYADSCLQINHDLMNYDTVSTSSQYPFYRWNPEVIFSAASYPSGPAAAGYRCHVDSLLFRSYETNDLRKTLFFKYGDYFFGTYDQDGFCFAGISTAEMFLTRSECLARAGNMDGAMADLNHLLQTRWAARTFVPHVAIDANDALQQILHERRKELLFRGIRWVDLRRLNKDSRIAHTTLTRTVKGIEYTLPPDDPRWVLPIPDYVISFNPQMPQNVR